MSVRALLFCIALAVGFQGGMVNAQGFAGLGTSADGFAVPKPGVPFSFPADHGPHPDYRIEWWYLTADLRGADGKDYGVQWTLFRSALSPGAKANWSSPQIWMGNAAVTTPTQHFVAEKFSRDGSGAAGVTATPFAAWIDDWQMKTRPDKPAGGDALSHIDLTATGASFRYDLTLDAKGPILAQGDGGYSVKSAGGQASEYYSQPFYAAKGTLKLPGGDVAVTGDAWLDREWSSQPLSADQKGWDWFSLHLENGEKLMGFRLRDSGAGFTSATWIAADGKPTPLPKGALTMTPLKTTNVSGHTVPTEWRLDIPARNFSVTTSPLNAQAWMATRFPYWEGPISFQGTQKGRGYLEMTGYD
ncbi:MULTISPECIES: lipocalin-like domain-containing protein [Rhizobium]|uniref:Lipocalin-like domain-containing protein n=1 Tax=Rhizobium rhododendri TaxID=2506430 RepID=A0ABY8ILH7_9HYPH|nr:MULTISPECIES: lipocalin-like domain-containing protein [Rhizobium]MBZ5758021.1 iron ABC transporter permease [Rhizobium sp. VS19-DR96]MBZ5765149.1 iron ABC transporter permease [Rhizobium sp. VS19-DR129.2]MBZ5772692.1 iron ABC transporter permease [Rhizobium sp. VS19-DRK62.2]MBZ5782621.1 iron ABC transporter permease [Rhizobium sp. VS19-DR121]MBZ5800069.1 iron ABC transporter permease [Rhizobium sp. VS19-DR181]